MIATLGMIAMGAITGMSATATGAAIVMIATTIATIGALIAIVTGVIAAAMSEIESITRTKVAKQGAYTVALLFWAGF